MQHKTKDKDPKESKERRPFYVSFRREIIIIEQADALKPPEMVAQKYLNDDFPVTHYPKSREYYEKILEKLIQYILSIIVVTPLN